MSVVSKIVENRKAALYFTAVRKNILRLLVELFGRFPQNFCMIPHCCSSLIFRDLSPPLRPAKVIAIWGSSSLIVCSVLSECKCGRGRAEKEAPEKSLVQGSHAGQQSQPGVRTSPEALSTRDGIGRRQRRRQLETQGD